MWRWLLDMGEADWGDLSRWEIAWQGARRWPLLLLGGVMLALLVVHLYRGQGRRLSPWRRWLMQGAKVAALLLLLAILLEPVLRAERTTPVRSALGVLVDDSLSMGIRDRYLSPEARRLVEGSAAGPLLDQPQSPARMEILKRLLADPDLDPLNALSREFDLKVFRFGEEVEETTPAEIAALEPRSASTDLGSAIRRSLDAFQGRSLSALVLLTDGQHNRGLDPVLAAEAARGQGVRLYAMGFGEPVARDLELTHLLAEDVVFADEEVPLYVKLRQSGFAGTTAEVVLHRGEVEMVRRAVTLGEAPEQTVSLHFTPDLVGTHTYTVELVPQPGELLDTNNQVSKVLRVIDQAIRVLYLEEEPRWFWRFFTAAALRDKRLRLSILLRSADPTLESDPNYVFEFPESRQDMLGYDVVVFGDVNPAYFTDEQLTLLEEFVRTEGGGVPDGGRSAVQSRGLAGYASGDHAPGGVRRPARSCGRGHALSRRHLPAAAHPRGPDQFRDPSRGRPRREPGPVGSIGWALLVRPQHHPGQTGRLRPGHPRQRARALGAAASAGGHAVRAGADHVPGHRRDLALEANQRRPLSPILGPGRPVPERGSAAG